jgi:hypothetical protein
MQTETAVAPVPHTATDTSRFHRLWPTAIMIFMGALTLAWVALLGYGLVRVIADVF